MPSAQGEGRVLIRLETAPPIDAWTFGLLGAWLAYGAVLTLASTWFEIWMSREHVRGLRPASAGAG